MKKLSLTVLLFALSALALAQQQPPKPPTPPAAPAPPAATETMPTARPDDVKSISAIVNALYDVISGPPGERDWTRFRSLFIPEARLIFNGAAPNGDVVRRVMSAGDYAQRAGGFFMKEGFFERGIANRVDRFGHIAQVFSTYESRHEKDGAPFARGINSIQLAYDGQRWYVVTIMWDQESPNNKIPEQYLTGTSAN